MPLWGDIAEEGEYQGARDFRRRRAPGNHEAGGDAIADLDSPPMICRISWTTSAA